MESRMRGDMQVRFGGRYEETYCRKAARRLVPSLRAIALVSAVALIVYGQVVKRLDSQKI